MGNPCGCPRCAWHLGTAHAWHNLKIKIENSQGMINAINQ